MSEIVKSKCKLKDLDCIAEMAKAFGGVLVKGKTEYRHYYGVGKCTHAIEHPDAEYGIGVTETEDGYELAADFWQYGKWGGLAKTFGSLDEINDAYQHEVIRKAAAKVGKKVYKVACEQDAAVVNKKLGLSGKQKVKYEGLKLTVCPQ